MGVGRVWELPWAHTAVSPESNCGTAAVWTEKNCHGPTQQFAILFTFSFEHYFNIKCILFSYATTTAECIIVLFLLFIPWEWLHETFYKFLQDASVVEHWRRKSWKSFPKFQEVNSAGDSCSFRNLAINIVIFCTFHMKQICMYLYVKNDFSLYLFILH